MGEPLTEMLISERYVFTVDAVTHEAKRFPVFTDAAVSIPDGRTEDWEPISVANELVWRILDLVIWGHLRNAEFGDALEVMRANTQTLKIWYARWKGLSTTVVRAGPVSQAMCMGWVLGWMRTIYEKGWSDSSAGFLEKWMEGRRFEVDRLPIMSALVPFREAGAHVRPEDVAMAGTVKWRWADETATWMEGFTGWPILGWAGDRMRDMVVADARHERGLFLARKVVYPCVLLSVVSLEEWSLGEREEEGETKEPAPLEVKNTWRAWKRFGTWLSWCLGGAAVYLKVGTKKIKSAEEEDNVYEAGLYSRVD